MIPLQPVDIGRDRGRAGLDAAVISIHALRARRRFAGRVIEEHADVIMQRGLVALQRQGIVAALIDDLLSNRALAVERIGGYDRPFQ